jgi:NitT/TauT family transport system substrate-binding protein
MTMMPTRRQFLTSLSLARAAGLLSVPRARADAGALETTTVRFLKPGLCVSTLFVAEEFLRAEGFTDIRYVDSALGATGPVARGEVDFSPLYASQCVRAIDAGEPLMLLAGVMVGCFELFAREGIGSVAELKGKNIGVQSAGSLSQQLPTLMAAQVGLDPVKDIHWITDPSIKPIELFVQGKIDAFLGFPPEPQDLRARHIGHVIVHRRGSTVVAIFLLHAREQPGLRPSTPDRDQARAACDPQGNGPLRHRTGAGCATARRRRFYSTLRLCPANAERQPLQMEGI